ncbi:hypothetical protein [Amycolatopsis sp. NPDC102389]
MSSRLSTALSSMGRVDCASAMELPAEPGLEKSATERQEPG